MEQELAIKLQDDGIHPRSPDGSRVEESVSVAVEEVKPAGLGWERLASLPLGRVWRQPSRLEATSRKQL